jgi:hypothetical protein
MPSGEELSFDAFRTSERDGTFVDRQLDEVHLIRLPDLSSERWVRGRDSIMILHAGQGELSAHLTGDVLRVENTVVREKRRGVAQGMMRYLFAVALPNGAKHMRGVAFSRGIIGMYAKMVGVENLELGETSAPANDFHTIMNSLPPYPVNDSYATYQFELCSLADEYIAPLAPDIMADPVVIPPDDMSAR